MEPAQLLEEQSALGQNKNVTSDIELEQTTEPRPSSPVLFRTRTPSLPGEDTTGVDSLSRLESALKIRETEQTQIPELIPVSDAWKKP